MTTFAAPITQQPSEPNDDQRSSNSPQSYSDPGILQMINFGVYETEVKKADDAPKDYDRTRAIQDQIER